MKNSNKTFSIAIFMFLGLIFVAPATIPATVSAEDFVPVVDESGEDTTESEEPVFVPIVDESGEDTTEGEPIVFPEETPVTEAPAPEASSRSGSRSGGRSGFVPTDIVTVAVAEVATSSVQTSSFSGFCPYINTFIVIGANNDSADVLRLQTFLNVSEGASLALNGVYDEATQNAVGIFQAKYANDILAPWNGATPSNNVYLTTKKKINELACGQAFELTVDELAEIARVRAAILAGTSTAGTLIGSSNASSTIAGATSTDDNLAAAFFGGEFLGKFFRFVKGIFTGSN